MAYVRKTDTLVHDIAERVNEMSRAAQAPFRTDNFEVGTVAYASMREAVVNKTWEAVPELKGRLPDDWCGLPTRVDVVLRDDAKSIVSRFILENVTSDPMRLSPEYKRQSYPDVTLFTSDLTGAAAASVEAATDNDTKCNQIREQFKTVRQQLTAFMEQHASLNSMLTEMPELEMYVPDRYMQKYRAKSAPRAKVERPTNVQDLKIDVDALAAAAITHRIVTAGDAS
jgi:hypothetical protein